ncbi:MAG: flagellar hook-length control protein FliK [Magnetococcales bacterium]|nr:flagellar hook-length control protein FliK [Magnetococcales bacterium]
MIISQLVASTGEPIAKGQQTSRQLSMGSVLSGRVSDVNQDGKGVFRLSDGRSFSFTGGQGLRAGEDIRLEVTRLAPEVTLKLVGSESQAASKMAQTLEQSLFRAPDTFGKLLTMAGLESQAGKALFTSQGSGNLMSILGKGQGITELLQKALPNVSAEKLLQGNLSELVKLLESGSRKELTDAVRLLKQAATNLKVADNMALLRSGISQANIPEALSEAKGALSRLGDLLTMQEILPRATQENDPTLTMGYRLFWLNEGGVGEAIWQQQNKNKRGGKEDEKTSVLLSLNMTELGAVQARIALWDGKVMINLAAEEEGSIAALRSKISTLRHGLQEAELPLHGLELGRLKRNAMNEARQEILGKAAPSGFSMEA